MIEFSNGDIFDSDAEVLVNPVNCVGVMGKGLALEFKKRFPNLFASYHEVCMEGKLKPGTLHTCLDLLLSGKTIVDFPTKVHWKDPSRMEYITSGLEALRMLVVNCEYHSVAIPPLGCGLGGLDWNEVKNEIIKTFDNLPDIRVIIYEPR